MQTLLSYRLLAFFTSLATALPNPAVNRIDAAAHQSHSISSQHTIITRPPAATATHRSLEARDPAIGYMIDVVRPNSQSGFGPFSVSASVVSDACKPFITLEARDPAVNRIDAIGNHAVSASAVIKSPCAVLDGSFPFPEPTERLIARNPAVNRIDAVGQDVIAQSVRSLDGGSPITIDSDDIKELNAAATQQPTAAGSIPAISVDPTANLGVPAASGAPSPASAISNPVRFDVPNTSTSLIIYYHPDQVIPKLDLGQALAETLIGLRRQVLKEGKDTPLPSDEWSYIKEKWDCIILCDANIYPGPGGRKQRLTYGILHSTMTGLWGVLFSKGNYFGAAFHIYDSDWGWVGSGIIKPWEDTSEGGVAVNATTS